MVSIDFVEFGFRKYGLSFILKTVRGLWLFVCLLSPSLVWCFLVCVGGFPPTVLKYKVLVASGKVPKRGVVKIAKV